MVWVKLGRVFCANGQSELMISGGRTPVPLHIGGDDFRVYFASYDVSGRGRIFSLEFNIHEPNKVFNLVSEPVFDIGATGFFDDNGVIPSDLIKVGDDIYFYTIGFSVKNQVIFDASTGLAISHDGGVGFERFNGPVLDRGVDDPCFAASPCVLKENDCWRMWYVSCDHWEPEGDGYRHYYNIKHRSSKDGIYWDSHAVVCIDYENEHEYAISRPSVIRDDNGMYRMWYSFRARLGVEAYRIGYAESFDGLSWVRKDASVGIGVSDSGWDSEMICYPKVFRHNEKTYMFYNGNGYGKTGFGLAVLEE